MRHGVMLTIASLLSILLLTFHLTEDFLNETAGMNLGAFLVSVLVLVVWLYATLVLAGRRSGYVIMLIMSLFGASMGVMHTMKSGVDKSNGFFFVWTLIALGITGIFSFILSAQGLWSLRRSNKVKLE